MLLLLYVAIGGAVGAAARYLLTSFVTRMAGSGYPYYGTFAVNLSGCFAMGVLIGFFAQIMPRGKELHALLALGMLSSFTTFSAFSMETFLLYERQGIVAASGYALASIITSVLALVLGMWMFRQFAA